MTTSYDYTHASFKADEVKRYKLYTENWYTFHQGWLSWMKAVFAVKSLVY